METSQGRGRNRIGRRDVEAGEGGSGFSVDRQGRPVSPRGAARDGARGSGRRLLAPLGRFLRDTRAGATAITAAALVMMTLGGTALIVDHLWLVGQRDALKSAADAAAVAATLELLELPSNMSDGEVEAALQPTAERYVRFNVSGNLPADARRRMEETLEVSLMVDRAAGVVDVAARADLGGTLLSALLLDYAGPEDGIAVEAGVGAEVNPIEVVLAIDISGSMRRDLEGNWAHHSPDNRINTVKRAAAEPGRDPESRRVEAGRGRGGAMASQRPPRRERPGGMGAQGLGEVPGFAPLRQDVPVHAGAGVPLAGRGPVPALPGRDNLERLPGRAPHLRGRARGLRPRRERARSPLVRPLRPGLLPCRLRIRLPVPGAAPAGRVLAAVLLRRHERPAGPCRQQARGIQYGCEAEPPPILPLTSERRAIESAIGRLEADTGETHSALGVLWGQRLLSHSWKIGVGRRRPPRRPRRGR